MRKFSRMMSSKNTRPVRGTRKETRSASVSCRTEAGPHAIARTRISAPSKLAPIHLGDVLCADLLEARPGSGAKHWLRRRPRKDDGEIHAAKARRGGVQPGWIHG
jgi:hypothetical protein